ncbi:MAG: AMP-binding protein, partial [Deferrisomatales bacterium]
MTIPQMIRNRHDRWKDRRCLMVKRDGAYRELTWGEYYGASVRTGLALTGRGLGPGDRAAVLSETRHEWAVADTAILTAAAITVPIYPSLSRREVRELLVRSGARVLFVSDAEQVEKVLPLLDEVEGFELLVAFEAEALPPGAGPRAVSLAALMSEAEGVDPARLDERLASAG